DDPGEPGLAREGRLAAERTWRGARARAHALGRAPGTWPAGAPRDREAGGRGAAEPRLGDAARAALRAGRPRVGACGAVHGRPRGDAAQPGDCGLLPTAGGGWQAEAGAPRGGAWGAC